MVCRGDAVTRIAPNRRAVLAGLAAVPFAPALSRAATGNHVVVVGGGFGGASLARMLRRLDPATRVSLVEREAVFHTCPLSNGVLGGLWTLDRIAFGYDGLRAAGVEVIRDTVAAVDPDTRSVALHDGGTLSGDILVLAPGIQFDWAGIEGLSPETAEAMPHAWKAGPQTQLLRDQLVAMEDGGTVVIGVPRPPFRCPPGPYERACLIAHYLKAEKPASKILILDAQDGFSKQGLFEEAWAALYPGMIERIPGSQSGAVLSVDPAKMRVSTGFDDVTAAVANIIPPQKAAQILIDAGLDDGLGWCPVDPVSFESTLARDVYILGDAALAGDMPKSGFSANVQAKVAALAILARLQGAAPGSAKLINVCYSLAAPDYGFSIADVFRQDPQKITLMQSEGRTTEIGASADVHTREARNDRSWFDTITSEIWG